MSSGHISADTPLPCEYLSVFRGNRSRFGAVLRWGCGIKPVNLRECGERDGTNGSGVLSILLYSGLSFEAIALQMGHSAVAVPEREARQVERTHPPALCFDPVVGGSRPSFHHRPPSHVHRSLLEVRLYGHIIRMLARTNRRVIELMERGN